ncbi:MAG TPA: hypothetical protein VHD33_05655 [Legionellaceae bacterium]|nr:hypothetical protein [Legionellaceae bacterium]
MLGTIAFITIFSAIIVFFVDELTAYIKALLAKPYVFLMFAMILCSALLEMYQQNLLWLLITVWIGLLLVVQWLCHYLSFAPIALFLAKFIVIVMVSLTPLAISVVINNKYKKIYFNSPKKSQKRSYMVCLFLWVIMVLVFALGPPGSDFSG